MIEITQNTDSPEPRKYRRYRKITPLAIARLQAEIAVQGNATAAVRTLEPDSASPSVRGHEMMSKAEPSTGIAYIEEALGELAVEAVDRIRGVISSVDEKNALKASMFVFDHVRGQAVKRSESRTIKVSIETVLR